MEIDYSDLSPKKDTFVLTSRDLVENCSQCGGMRIEAVREDQPGLIYAFCIKCHNAERLRRHPKKIINTAVENYRRFINWDIIPEGGSK